MIPPRMADFAQVIFAPLAVTFFLGCAAYFLGGHAARWARVADLSLALRLTVGLAGLALLGFTFGVVGFLKGAAWLTAALGAAGAWTLWRQRSSWPRWPTSTFGRWLGALGSLGAALLVITALYPPTAFDGTMYHLPFAKAFVRVDALPFLPDLRFPVFPQATEVLYALGMILGGGEGAAHLLGVLATALTAALLFEWGREGFGVETGALAAALWLGAPIVVYLAGTAYIEPMLGLYFTAALLAADRFRTSGHGGLIAIAGFLAGSALGVKYLGLLAIPAAGLLVLSRRSSWKDRAKNLAALSTFALLAAGPWLARNEVLGGNPVFPFLPGLFGATPWGPVEIWNVASPKTIERLQEVPSLLWKLVFDRAKTGGMPPWSPFLLLGALLALTLSWKHSRLRGPLLATFVYLSGFLVLPLDARYLLAVAGPLAVAGAWAISLLLPPRLRITLALLAVAPGFVYALFHLHRLGPLPTTAVARESFLAERYPALPAIRFLDRSLGERYTLYAFHAEDHTYFPRGRFLGDWNGTHPFSVAVAAVDQGADQLADLLADWRVDHLLVRRDLGPPMPEGPAFDRRFERVYDDGRVRVWRLRSPVSPALR